MVTVLILIILGICILAGYYRGVIYSAISIGLTLLSFFLALIMIPVVARPVRESKTLYSALLYYFEGYPVKEIGELLRLPENTVSTRLRRARAKLKDTLTEE